MWPARDQFQERYDIMRNTLFYSWSLQEEDELVVASCVLRSFDEDAYDSPDEEEEWTTFS